LADALRLTEIDAALMATPFPGGECADWQEVARSSFTSDKGWNMLLSITSASRAEW
jgi:dihydrofolate reductase